MNELSLPDGVHVSNVTMEQYHNGWEKRRYALGPPLVDGAPSQELTDRGLVGVYRTANTDTDYSGGGLSLDGLYSGLAANCRFSVVDFTGIPHKNFPLRRSSAVFLMGGGLADWFRTKN